MPYDEELADRIRAAIASEPDVTEKKMFGGLGFMVGGHLAVAASSDGGVILRLDPASTAGLLARDGVAPMEMRGRAMNGWLHLDPVAVATDEALSDYVARGVAHVRTLPDRSG